MKARLLKKLMMDCGYYPNDSDEYIAMGSPLCSKLISVNKKTLEIEYALDDSGRSALLDKQSHTLLFIWDKFQELIDSGQIHDIINGNDDIENPLPVWTFEEGKLVETYTDKYGWPNTTYDGKTMFENTHFKTRKEAIEKGLREYEAGISLTQTMVNESEERLAKQKSLLEKYKGYVEHFKSLKNEKSTNRK